MKDEPMTREAARRFLLGTVDDSERHRIESLFMTDATREIKLSWRIEIGLSRPVQPTTAQSPLQKNNSS